MHENIKEFLVGHALHLLHMGPISSSTEIFKLDDLDGNLLDVAYLFHSGKFEYVKATYYPNLRSAYPVEIFLENKWQEYKRELSISECKEYLKEICGESVVVPVPVRDK